MNKQEAKQMIAVINNEMEQNEERVSQLITRNDQLNCAMKNLTGWLLDKETSAYIPKPVDVAEAFATAVQTRKRAKFEKLGKTPLPKGDKPETQKRATSSYWSLLTPKQRQKEMARRRALGERRKKAKQ